MLQSVETLKLLQRLNFVAGNFQHGKIIAVQINKLLQIVIFEKVVAQLELVELVILTLTLISFTFGILSRDFSFVTFIESL